LQAVSTALKRNENGRCSDIDGHKIDHRQHWATPTETMRILRSLTRFSTECFASIFNADTRSATVITAHREDRAFGALFDAFAHRWSGSFYFNAEYNVEPMRDAVEHAIASVQAATDPACPSTWHLGSPATSVSFWSRSASSARRT
jgi:hypothetical protein